MGGKAYSAFVSAIEAFAVCSDKTSYARRWTKLASVPEGQAERKIHIGYNLISKYQIKYNK
jgi:hypothetical protein